MNRIEKLKKLIEKIETKQRWNNIFDPGKNWNTNFSFPLLPIAIRVAAKTIGCGGESEERLQKRKRILKLKRILSEEEFNNIVDEETFDEIMEIKNEGGLVSVQPLSLPSGMLLYMDYKFEETAQQKAKRIRDERLKKFERIQWQNKKFRKI